MLSPARSSVETGGFAGTDGWRPTGVDPLTIHRTGEPCVGRVVSCPDAYTRLVAAFVEAIRSGREANPSAVEVLARATLTAAVLRSPRQAVPSPSDLVA